MKRLIVILSLCLIGLSTSLAIAQDIKEHSEFARKGLYIGGGGIYAIEDFDGSNISFDDSAGFNIRAGYRFHPHLAIEGLVERALKFDVKNGRGSVNTWLGTVNAKAFALTGQIQPYGLLGIGAMNAATKGPVRLVDSKGRASKSETDVAFRFGGGMDGYLTKDWVVNFEGAYVAGRRNVKAVDQIILSVGLQYRF